MPRQKFVKQSVRKLYLPPKLMNFEPGLHYLVSTFEENLKVNKKFPYLLLINESRLGCFFDAREFISLYPHVFVDVNEKGIFSKPDNWPYMPDEEVLILNLRDYYEFWNPNTFSEYMNLPHDFSNLELSIV